MNDTHSDHDYPPLINRDISWIYFNHRILQEARRDEVPLLERLNFLGIYSNNLDEFYRVRMATQARMAELKGKHLAAEAEKARILIRRLSQFDDALSKEFERATTELRTALDAEGIHIVDNNGLSDLQAHQVRCMFRQSISGYIAPVWLSRLHELSKNSDSHIYLAVVAGGEGIADDYALVELPTAECGRFLTLPSPDGTDKDGQSYIMYIDDAVRFCLPMIFPDMGYSRFEAYSIKFTKDAEMELDSDLGEGIFHKVAKAVKSRKYGVATRVIYDSDMPQPLLKAILNKLPRERFDTVKPSGRYHNHKDLMDFPVSSRLDLLYPAWTPAIPPELKENHSLIKKIQEKDRMIQVPYQSFDYIIRLLQEAAVSKNVKSIRISLYRVAHDSKIVKALICAARNGKKVTAMVELLARFDEKSNIHVAREMQEAGVNVIFGVEGLKTHSKIAHIGVIKGRDIAVIGTGNFHEGNARVYTDCFLMTACKDIVDDVASVFDFLRKPYKTPRFRRLLVSPMSMREQFTALIEEEIKAARRGEQAWIKIKINHVTDKEMCHEILKAAMAGVRVEMLVRGNCSLTTASPQLNGNLTIRGIIDRYLEHSRIFIFRAGGKELTFIGSADWMPRNLDNRVEVVTPIDDLSLKAELRATVEAGLADTDKARIVDGTGMNLLPDSSPDKSCRSQLILHNYYMTLAKNASVMPDFATYTTKP